MKALVFLALITPNAMTMLAADSEVQKTPDNLVENGYTLEVQFAAERTEYMNPVFPTQRSGNLETEKMLGSRCSNCKSDWRNSKRIKICGKNYLRL